MKPIFHHRAVNGPFEDPSVYIRVLREGTGMLFDAGDISRLPQRELLKLSDVFVTHMHIDHFVGFDAILRALLRRPVPLAVHGPSGIIACIEGKLGGYTWNLIAEYPLTLHVSEVGEEGIERASFGARDGFVKSPAASTTTFPVMVENDLLMVKAIRLSHDIPTLGYRIEEKMQINIDKVRLAERRLPVGPWLNVLKKAVRTGKGQEMVDTGNGRYRVVDLEDIYRITEGQKVSYIMDSAPDEATIAAVTEFVSGSDTLYIEAYFTEEDRALAESRNHFTARIAGTIARDAGVRDLQLMHFSPRYREAPERITDEAFANFRR